MAVIPVSRGSRRVSAPHLVATFAGAAYVALALLVRRGLTIGTDWQGYLLFRPRGTWGRAQLRTITVLDAFPPAVFGLLLLLVAVWTAARRRSWRPLAFAATAGAATALVTAGTKLLVARANPTGVIEAGQGSFPSGHVASSIICASIAAMLLRPRTGWWQWLVVAAVAGLMSGAVLVVGLHWVSDVLGGTLLGLLVVALASLTPLRRPSGKRPA